MTVVSRFTVSGLSFPLPNWATTLAKGHLFVHHPKPQDSVKFFWSINSPVGLLHSRGRLPLLILINGSWDVVPQGGVVGVSPISSPAQTGRGQTVVMPTSSPHAPCGPRSTILGCIRCLDLPTVGCPADRGVGRKAELRRNHPKLNCCLSKRRVPHPAWDTDRLTQPPIQMPLSDESQANGCPRSWIRFAG
jgi:hypothetical protein